MFPSLQCPIDPYNMSEIRHFKRLQPSYDKKDHVSSSDYRCKLFILYRKGAITMSTLDVIQLHCEHRTEWLGSDRIEPRFSWIIQSDQRATMQYSYHLQVSNDQDDWEQLVWDSGIVISDQSIQVPYQGSPLQSKTRYYYRVQVQDQWGITSAWSHVQWWETALLDVDEWQAHWITPYDEYHQRQAESVFQLRKSFVVQQKIVSARIYATAAGLYELSLNGTRVGDEWFTPGWTSYEHRHQYQTYDVTDYLRVGDNAIGVSLADGWYSGRLGWENKRDHYGKQKAILLQLHLYYENGEEEIVTTDTSWQSAPSPITLASIYDGEIYDARLEQQGWDQPSYDATHWSGVESLPLSYHQLIAQENWAVRVTEILTPIEVIHTPAGEIVLDMGQNMVGRIRFTGILPASTHYYIHHAEILDQQGNFYTGNLRTAKQSVQYIAKGHEQNTAITHAPRFSFQGFRYIRIEGLAHYTDDQLLQAFTGEVLHSDMPSTGSFECSHPLINQLQRNIVWGQRGNFLDVPTDCPQRDERLGWTGDAQVFIRTAAFNYDVAPFFQKWLRDLSADQRSNGSVPFVIPDVLSEWDNEKGDTALPASAAWGDAAVICPWIMYLQYGDQNVLQEQYSSMKAWVDYIYSQGDDPYLWNTGFHFGDWLGLDAKENSYIGATPVDLVATSYFAYSTRIVRDTAVILDYAEEVKLYSERLNQIIQAYRNEFVTPAGRLAAPTQTAHALALMFDLLDERDQQRTASTLNDLVVKNEYHLTTGFVGTPYLCFALSDHGYHDTAIKLLLQEQYPSWLYPLSKGATTIWEHWDGIKPDGTFWPDDMNSYNHYAYGAIGEWLYRYVAGLDMDESSPAYRKIKIRPLYGEGEITSARAVLESAYGTIQSSWLEQGNQRQLELIIPANTTAEVILEHTSLSSIQESHQPLSDVEGIQNTQEIEGTVSLVIGSGHYHFSYEYMSRSV